MLSTIVAKAVQLSGTEAGAIYVFDDLQRLFQLRATNGMDQELIDALPTSQVLNCKISAELRTRGVNDIVL